jgi:MerR family glutamine synthetase transcriptional repressor
MDPVPRDMAVLTIGIVKQLTGLTIRQIRYYEELGLVLPFRSKGDQRLYSINDVARLLQIKDMMDQEYPLAQIKKVLIPPTVPVEPETRPTPSEQSLDDREILQEVRGQIQSRKERSWSTTIIEGQLSHFYQNQRKK